MNAKLIFGSECRASTRRPCQAIEFSGEPGSDIRLLLLELYSQILIFGKVCKIVVGPNIINVEIFLSNWRE